MEEKELKTSPKQRIFIAVIAVIMVGSIIASYAAIVINGSKTSNSGDSKIDEAKIAQYEEEYQAKQAEFTEATKNDFDVFVQYKGEIKAYNEATANEEDIQTKDLLKGTGDKLAEGDNNYLAYYVGWCADESVFDSTFDNNNDPTGFVRVLTPSEQLIAGWKSGVVGMRLGGVREITIPGDLAYGESGEICGGGSKPLKFLVMAVANEDPLKALASEMEIANMKVQYALKYGVDYDQIMNGQ